QRRRRAARGGELDLWHQGAARVLLAKQDRPRDDPVHVRRAERARKALALRAHQVDRALAVDLRTAEEEHVDAPLPGEVEELARAFGEGIGLPPLLQRYPERGINIFSQKTTRSRNGRRRADRSMARAIQQPRDHAGEVLFRGVRIHSSRYLRNPSGVFAALAYSETCLSSAA